MESQRDFFRGSHESTELSHEGNPFIIGFWGYREDVFRGGVGVLIESDAQLHRC